MSSDEVGKKSLKRKRHCAFSTHDLGMMHRDENDFLLHKLSEMEIRVDLSKGRKDFSASVAAETTLRKYYKSVADGTQTKAIFVPDFFLSSYPEVMTYPGEEECSSAPPSKKSRMDNLRGDKTERTWFEKLQTFIESKSCKQKKILGFHGVKTQSSEIDFIMVCEELRLIILIECKATATTNQCQKANSQLLGHKLFLERNVDIAKDWRFVRCLFSLASKVHICDKCSEFALGPETDIATWWSRVVSMGDQNKVTSKTKDKTYYNLALYLVFLCHLNRRYVTPPDVSARAMDDLDKKICTLNNLIMYSPDQLGAIYNTKRSAFFTSEFGTGKTMLLATKLMALARKYPEQSFYFIVMPAVLFKTRKAQTLSEICQLPTLVELFTEWRLRQESGKLQNAKVMSWQKLSQGKSGQTTAQILLDFITEHGQKGGHFFVDEYHEGYYKSDYHYVPPSKLPQMHAAARGNWLWVANNSDFSLNVSKKSIKKYFAMPELERNMRNCARITRAATKKMAEWDNFPAGRHPKKIHLDMELKRLSGTVASVHDALAKAIKHLHQDTHDLGVLLDDDALAPAVKSFFNKNYKDVSLYMYLSKGSKEASPNPRDFFSSGKKGIMVTDMYLAQGAEFRNLIFFCSLDKKGQPCPYAKGSAGQTIFVTEENCLQRAVVNAAIILVPQEQRR